MEWYHVKINWWYSSDKLMATHCIIPANSYGEALNEVLKDYGKEEIEDIKMWQDENYSMHGYILTEDEGDNENE